MSILIVYFFASYMYRYVRRCTCMFQWCLCACQVRWSLSIMGTTGTQLAVLYRGVPNSEVDLCTALCADSVLIREVSIIHIVLYREAPLYSSYIRYAHTVLLRTCTSMRYKFNVRRKGTYVATTYYACTNVCTYKLRSKKVKQAYLDKIGLVLSCDCFVTDKDSRGLNISLQFTPS